MQDTSTDMMNFLISVIGLNLIMSLFIGYLGINYLRKH
jgi:hypothetical protein